MIYTQQKKNTKALDLHLNKEREHTTIKTKILLPQTLLHDITFSNSQI